MSQDIVILGGARSPIGKFGGTLRLLTAVELGAHAVRSALARTGTPAERVDLCVVGHARCRPDLLDPAPHQVPGGRVNPRSLLPLSDADSHGGLP